MIETEELISKKDDLEEILNLLNAPMKSVELSVFDVIIDARKDYTARREKSLQKIDPILANPEYSIEQKKEALRAVSLSVVRKYGHAPAYILVVGFDPERPEHEEHTFGGNYSRQNCVGKNVSDSSIFPEMQTVANEDNAVLIKKDGIIHATNVHLTYVEPELILKHFLTDKKNADYESIFGFKQQVHTRHHSSAGASYMMPDTVVYSLGESGHVRRFYQGIVTFSTHEEENQLAKSRFVSPK